MKDATDTAIEEVNALALMTTRLVQTLERLVAVQKELEALRAATEETAREYGAIYRAARAEKMKPGLETGMKMMRLMSRLHGKDSWKESPSPEQQTPLRVVREDDWMNRTHDSETECISAELGKGGGR